MALAHPASSFAQLEFYLGYGNAEFAALNGKQVGDRLSPLTRIPQIGGTFSVTLFVRSLRTTNLEVGGGSAFIGFDTATTSGTSFFADASSAKSGAISKKLFADSLQLSSRIYQGSNASTGSPEQVTYEPRQSPRYSGSFGSGTTLRTLGLWVPFFFGTQRRAILLPDQVHEIATYSITNTDLAANEVFGEAEGENGVSIFHGSVTQSTGPNSRATFFETTPRTIGNPGGNVKYAVQAVPEPGTMIAVAAGLAAFARRRRSK